MIDVVYFLDLLGTFAFAYFGAHVGIRKHLDIFGIFTTAFLTAVGGSTLRDMLLGNMPIYFADTSYIVVIVAGVFSAIAAYKSFHKVQTTALFIDAVGLVTFAFLGAQAAEHAGLGAPGIIFLALVSAVGGGFLRDIAIAETPLILYRDVYATPAIVVGSLYIIFQGSMQNSATILFVCTCAYLVRASAIYFKWNLWGPWRKLS